MDTTKTTISVLSLLLVASLGGYMLPDGDYGDLKDAFYCNATELIQDCETVSSPSESSGLISRCYYPHATENRTTYKTCSSGWQKVYIPVVSNETNSTEQDILIKYHICEDANGLIIECASDEGEIILRVSNK